MAGSVHYQNGEKRMEKQIGCMSGFLQIFDRQQILAGKRIHSTKRLPPSTGVGASLEAVSSVESQESYGELGKPEPVRNEVVVPATDSSRSSPAENANGPRVATPLKSPLLVPIYELKGGTQRRALKYGKETLDIRATVDSKGSLPKDVCTSHSVVSTTCADSNTLVADGDDKQQGSPNVIARLMGLEPLSSSDHKTKPAAKPSLRRSASESRVTRDLSRSKYIDGNNFQVKQPNQTQKQTLENIVTDANLSNEDSVDGSAMKSIGYALKNLKSESPGTSPWRSLQQRRGFFDLSDIFPEPNQTTMSKHGDFEKKLKMRGMDEQSNDLSTLKQILEVLQLKGLLHSRRSPNRDSQRNFEPSLSSSIVVMKPWRSPASKVDYQRSAYDSRGARRYAIKNSLSIRPKREGAAVDGRGRILVKARNSSPTRIESNLKSCNSIVKRKPLSVEIQRRANESFETSSSINSPKLTPKKTGSAHHSSTNRHRRIEKPTGSSYISSPSSISESTVGTPSTTDTEISKCERKIEESSLLQRCDKLLHSIAEMNSTTESPPSSASPASVLDPGFDKDGSSSSSHSNDFKATPAVDLEDEIWSPSILSDDSDFIYISEILRASQYLHDDSNVFFSIEKQLYSSKDVSNVSKHRRKLVFDMIVEILYKNRTLPPWKAALLGDSGTSLKQIWFEFQKIQEINTGDGELGFISGVLKKDLYEINGWGLHLIETSEAIVDVERMIFKDLVSESVGDFAEFSGKCMFSRTQRKLVF